MQYQSVDSRSAVINRQSVFEQYAKFSRVTISIRAESLTKIYGRSTGKQKEIPALNDVSLRVAPGELFALVGPNGAGKSTLVKILLGIVRPTSGTAFILGKPITDPAAREPVGYLPEQMHYPPLLTPRTFLEMAGSLHGVPRAELKSRIAMLLELLDMSQWERTQFRKFSKGMLQRIGLAQALVHDPQVLFLDEPSDGLDPVGRRDFRELLKNFRTEGKAIFMNSHLLSEVEMVADRVAIIDKGTILRTGTLAEIVPAAGGCTVTVRGDLPERLHDALSLYPIVTAGGVTTIDLPASADLDELLAKFREENVAVESIVPKKFTLEDSFLALLRKKGGRP